MVDKKDVTKTARVLQDIPLADMVKNTAVAIIQAQAELDRTAIELTRYMGDPSSGIELGGQRRSLLELGFYPSFYQFEKVTIKLVVEIKVAESEEFNISGKLGASIPLPDGGGSKKKSGTSAGSAN